MKMLDLKARTLLLSDGIKQHKAVVVYVFENENNNQYRYRYSNIEAAIRGSKKWVVVGFLTHELKMIEKYLEKVKIVVIVRQTGKKYGLIRMIRKMKKCGIKVLFDLDDLVFDYRDLGVLMESVQEKSRLYWMGYIWGIRRIAKKVDGFIATNDFLAKKLKKSFKKPCVVIPNSLNEEQLKVSEKCLREKEHDGFVIGYFSGSPTHLRDFKMVESELVKFLKKHDDVKFMMVGCMELSGQMKEMVKTGQVKVVGLVDYLKLQELMSKVDVNIAPLVINDFTNSKSELKFFEAAAVETTTIASPTYTFSRAISDGKDGLLAKFGEWYEKIDYLYNNPAINQKMAKSARNYVLENYYGKNFIKQVEEAYELFG